MKVLYWNCRGLGNVPTRSTLRDMINTHKPIVIGIAKPKVHFQDIPSWYWHNLGYTICTNNGGFLPSLWVLIREDLIGNVNIVTKSRQQITTKIMHESKQFVITLLYGSCNRIKRRRLWSDIDKVSKITSDGWFVMGDFNICLGSHEKLGGALPLPQECNEFASAITNCSLTDMQPIRPWLTWDNKQNGRKNIQIRLDRILHNDHALNMWDNIRCFILNRQDSDHSPILLSCEALKRNYRKTFKFRSMWVDHENFFRDTEQFWRNCHFSGNPVFTLQRKLKELRGFLLKWNREVFGNIDNQLILEKNKLLKLQSEASEMGYSENSRKMEMEIRDKIEFFSFCKKKLAVDSCRVKWLQGGDRNSAYFHVLQRRKRANSGINALNIDGTLTEDQDAIQHNIITHY